ncbi:S-layer homology domain-containing protein [Tumebacillus avium]|uniref:S-layer homology domain-containing protein n=1 Tax=Tumebacillus avium TaxID=1903704 RepID=UPI0018DF1266|nr:S-layer homology domain-containing protein [Tumebacillus avium]
MNKSKKLTAAVAATAVASAIVAPVASAALNDIPNNYATAAINELVSKGIINGDEKGNFNPTANIKRQDFAIIMAKALNLDLTNPPATATFSDVPVGHYAFAAVEAAVKAKLISGLGGGKFGTNTNLTREQMATVFVNALGVDVTGYASKLNFSDKDSISSYAKNAVAFAVEAELLRGENGKFSPAANAERQQVAVVASNFLKAVEAYKVAQLKNVEATSATSLKLSFHKAVDALAATDVVVKEKATGKVVAVSNPVLAEDKMSATVTVGALTANTTYTVNYKARTFEVTTGERADFAGAQAVGAKKIAVKFTSSVDSAAAKFSLKKGAVSVVIEEVQWNADKTVATLVAADDFSAGTYTAAVTGLEGLSSTSANVVVAAEALTSIELDGNILPKSTATKFGFKALNQYGEDMELAPNAAQFTWVYSTALATNANSADNAAVNISNANIAVDSDLTVTVVANNGVKASKTFKIGKEVIVDTFTLGEVTNVDEDAERLTKDSEAYVAFEAKDQYGNVLSSPLDLIVDTDADNSWDAGEEKVQIVSSSANVSASYVVFDEDGEEVAGLNTAKGKAGIKLTVSNALNADETVVLTAIAPSGKTSNITVKLYKPALVDEVTVGAPTDVIADGDAAVYLPLTAKDQFGAVMTAKQLAEADLADDASVKAFVSSTGVSFDAGYDVETATGENQGKLKLTNVTGTGTVTITVVSASGKTSTTTFDVQAARFAQKVEIVDAATGTAGKLLQGASTKVDFKLYDQYGKEFTADGANKITFAITKVSGDDAGLTSTATAAPVLAESALSEITLAADAAKKGEYKLTVRVVKEDDSQTLSSATKNFTVIDGKTETLTYAVGELPTLYKGAADAANAYAKAVTVSATDANGVKVALPSNAIESVISSNTAAVLVDAATKKIYSANAILTADAKSTVTVVINTPTGTQVVNREVTVSVADLAVTDIKFVDADGEKIEKFAFANDTELLTGVNLFEGTDTDGVEVVVTDQFGGTSLSAAGNLSYYFSANDLTLADGEILDENAGVIAITEGTTTGTVESTWTAGKGFKLTVVNANGKSAVLNFTVTAAN